MKYSAQIAFSFGAGDLKCSWDFFFLGKKIKNKLHECIEKQSSPWNRLPPSPVIGMLSPVQLLRCSPANPSSSLLMYLHKTRRRAIYVRALLPPELLQGPMGSRPANQCICSISSGKPAGYNKNVLFHNCCPTRLTKFGREGGRLLWAG